MQRREFLRSSVGALAGAGMSVSTAFSASGVRPNRTRRILYVLGQFSQATPKSMQGVVETIGHSSFNIVVLSFLQAGMSNGNLTLLYNGNQISSIARQVPALLARLRSGFGATRRVMLSIGGWQQTPTFAAIRSVGVPAFVRQLTDQVIQPLGFDGIDIDLEPQIGGLDQWMNVHHEYGKTLAELTNEYKRVHPAHLVTHAPISVVAAELYVSPTSLPGVTDGLLAATCRRGKNNIDWLNVQFYEGGLIQGGEIAGYYCNSLAAPLIRMQSRPGVSRPLHFLTPLFQPQAKQPLAFCRQTIQAINQRCAGLHSGTIDGVALWDYRQVAPTIHDWSAGLDAALHPQGKL